MAKYQIWDGISDIYTPSNEKFTAEQWKERFPWVKVPNAKMVITAGVINGGCAMELEATKGHYKTLGVPITDDMTDTQVLQAIEDWETMQVTNQQPDATEQLAAAISAQNLMNILNT